jgi:S-(hydroxymethyl)glutathione dehydrogenase/alcohol dehydrogenase
VAIDVVDQKLGWARQFGASHTINALKNEPGPILQDLSRGRGFDFTVDTTGHAQVRETAYAATSHKGKTILAGVPDVNEKITIDSFPLHFGRLIIGSHGGETRPDEDIPRYIELYRRGKLKLDEMISHRFPLARINDAIDLVRKGEAMRCLVQMA